MLARTELLLAGTARRRRRGRVRGGTFHSVAHRTLRQAAARLGLPEGFSRARRRRRRRCLDLVRERARARGRRRRAGSRARRTLLDLYSRAVNTSRPLSAVVADGARGRATRSTTFAAVCRAYVGAQARPGPARLRRPAAVLAGRRCSTTALGPRLRGAFDHVLVDEYQDVNALQVDVLRALRRDDDRLTVVGDDAQAVYGFRAADPRHLLDFDACSPARHDRARAQLPVVASRSSTSPTPWRRRARGVHRGAAGGAGARRRRAPSSCGAPTRTQQAVAVCEQMLAHREDGVAAEGAGGARPRRPPQRRCSSSSCRAAASRT